ncbi:hypothetical protein DFQ26_005173 [Actinomortierella ambigua]|nr:hypothetical protein DFQ26_005173 [Actinomortierella ambigua]
MKITSLLQLSTTLALCIAAAQAADPKPTIGHTAVLIDNTVFIQGGQSEANTPQSASFSILLGDKAKGSMTDAKLLDITKLSQFSARDFHVAVKSTAGRLVSCGTMNGGTGAIMTCDNFNIRSYVSAPLTKIVSSAVNRGGMALAAGPETAYLMGGSSGTVYSKTVNVLKLTSDLTWRIDADMPIALRHHTANYVNNVGIVILGGQTDTGAAAPMNMAHVFKDFVWSNRTIAGDAVPARWGHTAVLGADDQIYVYGGLSTAEGPALADVYALKTTDAAWTWKKVNVQAEPRAFHTSTLLPDNTILNMFGTSGAGVQQAVASLSSFNPSANSWTAMKLPAAEVADTTPFKGPAPSANPPAAPTKTNTPPSATAPSAPAGATPSYVLPPGVVVVQPSGNNTVFILPTGTEPLAFPPETSNNPSDPNFKHSTGEQPSKNNTGMIAGVCAAVLVVLVVGGLLFQRRRRANGAPPLFARGGKKKKSSSAGAAAHSIEDGKGGDGSGAAGGVTRSFTIRKPASVNYVDDDNELDQTGHPRFKSDNDAQNHPYYGDRTPGLVEYDLSDTSGQKYGPSSVAERKRYVEQQQRKVMEEYEMSFQDYHPPSSPYPPSTLAPSSPYLQSTVAPSFSSNTVGSPGQTPTMGGRSPRAQHQQQKGIQQQYGGYSDYR